MALPITQRRALYGNKGQKNEGHWYKRLSRDALAVTGALVFLGAILYAAVRPEKTPAPLSKPSETPGSRITAHASWPAEYSFPHFVSYAKEADAVIVARILGTEREGEVREPGARSGIPYTDWRVEVVKAIKGRVNDGQTIIIRQTGSQDTFELDDDPLFRPGSSELVFLKEFSPGKYRDMGPFSRMEVDEKGVIRKGQLEGHDIESAASMIRSAIGLSPDSDLKGGGELHQAR